MRCVQFCCRAKIGDEIKKLRNMVVNSFAEASKIRERIQTAAESQIVANPFAHSTERTPVETVETCGDRSFDAANCQHDIVLVNHCSLVQFGKFIESRDFCVF